jgi:NAD(P)-dependent dehydrogenase (short-subunit alcohol dehydrogenase family)
MRRGGGGSIVMISSLSALIGLPFDGAYAASKFALEGASESLHYELEPFGIHVTLLEPGAYATELTGRAERRLTEPSLYPAFDRVRRARVDVSSGGGDPAEVAELVLRLLTEPRAQLRIPCGAQAAAVVARLATLDEPQRRAFALEAGGVT